MTESLQFEIEGGIATITLNRPERMNAFTWEMLDAWAAALTECRTNDAVSVGLITGAGRAFCSGGRRVGITKRGGRAPPYRQRELGEHEHKDPLAREGLDQRSLR